MKKSLAIACLVCVSAVSSFAQSAPNQTAAEVGAQRVAEHDAAWQRAHASAKMVKEPIARHKVKRPKHVKHAKQKIKRAG
jgi:Skp family chaperone for outer membrane proteins